MACALAGAASVIYHVVVTLIQAVRFGIAFVLVFG
jgi:hypothetical protein